MNPEATMNPEAELHVSKWTAGQIERRVAELGEWFHNIDLNGVRTAPNHFLGDYPMLKWRRFEQAIPADLTGKSVLDIGCNAGFYSVEMWRRGAARVLGIDSHPRYLAQARFVAEVLGAPIEFRQMSVYEVGELRERFDIVLFMGVLYHLRYPLLAIDLLHEHVVNDLIVVQSMLRGSSETERLENDYPFGETGIFERPSFPCMYFIEKKYSGDPTNWWIPNSACLAGMLRSAGFEILSHPEEEVYVCRTCATEIASEPILPSRRVAAAQGQA
jgi:tRNA (mo5U34)-methyltransferase